MSNVKAPEVPNVATLKMFESLLDKLSCWNFFSVMRTIFDEFVFSLHILDNIISLPGLYVRNVVKHYQHTTLEKLLPDEVCNDLLTPTLCKKKIGYPVIDNQILKKYKDDYFEVASCSPPISEKDAELFLGTLWEELPHYEFPNREVAFYFIVEQFESASARKLTTLIDKLTAISKTRGNTATPKCNPSPIVLQFMTDFGSVKDFVECGDVHLGKKTDLNGICSKHLMIADSQLKIPIVYTPYFLHLAEFDLDQLDDKPLLPYIRLVISTMKLLQIAQLVKSKSK